MKKLAIGCGVFLALGLAGSAAVSYVVYRKVTRTVTGFAELGSLPALEQSIRKQGPYSPPASGEPSRSQVDRLVEVQQAVRTRLGARVDEIERRYRRFRDNWLAGAEGCERCRTKADLMLHHRIRTRERPDLLYAPENLEVLCRSCHTRHHNEQGHTRIPGVR